MWPWDQLLGRLFATCFQCFPSSVLKASKCPSWSEKDLFHLGFHGQLLKFLQLSPGAIDLERDIFLSNYKCLGDVIRSPNTQWGCAEYRETVR